MAYTIRYSDLSKNPITIPNNTVLPAGTELDLTLYGKGKLDYGQEWDTNFLHLLENFADSQEPDAPTEGQIWFDTSGSPKANLLKYRKDDDTWDTAASQTYVNSQIGALLGSPAGLGPLPWSGAAAPAGWLLCDGLAVSRTTYSALFTAIGVTFGNGDGSTTFNVPDMRGRFPLGQNPTPLAGPNRVSRSEAQNVGGIEGDETVTLDLTEIPSHNHTASTSTDGAHDHTGATAFSDGAHTHTVEYDANGVDAKGGSWLEPSRLTGNGIFETTSSDGAHTHTVTIPTNSSSNHSHSVSIQLSGGDGAHENTPPFLTIQYIIKT